MSSCQFIKINHLVRGTYMFDDEFHPVLFSVQSCPKDCMLEAHTPSLLSHHRKHGHSHWHIAHLLSPEGPPHSIIFTSGDIAHLLFIYITSNRPTTDFWFPIPDSWFPISDPWILITKQQIYTLLDCTFPGRQKKNADWIICFSLNNTIRSGVLDWDHGNRGCVQFTEVFVEPKHQDIHVT